MASTDTLNLPQNCSEPQLQARRAELATHQTLYRYESPPTIPGIAFHAGRVEALPAELPRLVWKLRVAAVSARVALNFSGITPSSLWRTIRTLFDAVSPFGGTDDALDRYNAALQADNAAFVAKTRERFTKAIMSGSQFEELSPFLEAYRSMYRVLDMPYVASVFMEDRVFSRLRVAGYNPISLFRVDDVNEAPFLVDMGLDAMPAAGDTMAKAAREGRLFALDFSSFGAVKQKETRPEQQIIPCKALFAVDPMSSSSPSKKGALQPVAIELPDGIVYPPKEDDTATPSSSSAFSTRWAIAKLIVNNCDALHHELVAHLGRTHLLVQPFVLATMRQLPSSHPVHALLRPHFEGTLFINDTASRRLVAPGGDVDTIFAGDISAVMAWCGEQVVNNAFNASMPDVELRARGMLGDKDGDGKEGSGSKVDSPYRDDALEHFDALLEWCFTFLSLYYPSDDAVAADEELRAWADELGDPARGRVKDFGDRGDGRVRSVRYLARATAFVIFSASVQHAAVNFPQQALMSYAPAVAGAVYDDGDGGSTSMEEWVRRLTPIETAVDQVEILNVIGAVYHTRLGEYRSGEMPSRIGVREGLKRFGERLETIDGRIGAREKENDLKYEFLRPANVPQSINI